MTKYYKLQQEHVAAAAFKLGVPPALLQAVVDIESNGIVGWDKNGELSPVKRFEGHKFYNFIPSARRGEAMALGLANPKVGGVKNPRDQAVRHKLFMRAYHFDSRAAIMATSFGVGQVMGFNYAKLGWDSPFDFYNYVMTGGAVAQVNLMVEYIIQFGLADELKRADFAGFARGYNGPMYEKNRYASRMAAAYKRFSGAPMASPKGNVISMGSMGPRVTEWQRQLREYGYIELAVDGDFGRTTKAVTCYFQAENSLRPDGIVGAKTLAMMISALVRGQRQKTRRHVPIDGVVDVSESQTPGLPGFIVAIIEFFARLFQQRR